MTRSRLLAIGATWAAIAAGVLVSSTLQGSALAAAPIVGLAATPGGGYWLVGSDGGVFTFGNAHFASSESGHLVSAVIDLDRTPSGAGYWLATSDGGISTLGDASFFGCGAEANPQDCRGGLPSPGQPQP